ncbi:sigma-54-dependent Fis family transcriptional regulator [Caballeronia novacaledonica]|jgi:DNA-binding NtrC family response regulator/predicted hydrocarbon binding protein|uniref:Sigma-54-dependent Fis family transcriptional regulator n=2 Tax=Caballeronia TaxID=1827195 RepID=A0AA37IKE0_9BURK|nr:sigma-54-dependent Fis family transcriptional regulator [Caballeronia novacaledonica]GJH30877.1 sigma-54-dependent Fis family transcriptional regulator [Caballeronia novacaledonica]
MPRREKASVNAQEGMSMVAPKGAPVDSLRYPDIADLMSRLHFSPGDGRIWLDEQRMLLVHTGAMGSMRRELIESLGIDAARGLLTRMGYNSGARDAELARRVRPENSITEMFAVGPQLHMLEGMTVVEPVRLEIDVERGQYYGEFIWKNCAEDEEHVRIYGIGAEPVCWTQLGYAAGYTSVFMGRPILYREVECRALGQAHCRIIGKPVEEWGEEAADDLRFMQAQAFTQGLSANSAGGQGAFGDENMVGASPGFNAVCHMIRRVAGTRATVLFLGESGVGKEVCARTLHRISKRSDGPFVAVNCAAIPEALVESELFGVDKGGFTDATQSRPGRFERAHGGTLFLDEIGILSMTAQGKLLRALQEGEIERVGGTETRRVDVRVVAATNLDLRDEIRAGRFREDLYFRLNVFPIRVPSLRERREDLPVLLNHMLRKYRERHERNVTGFTPRALDALLNYGWPGNIRELENIVERGVILANHDGAIDIGHLFTSGESIETGTFGIGDDGSLTASRSLLAQAGETGGDEVDRVTRKVNSLLLGIGGDVEPTSLDDIETALLKSAVQRADGNLSAAARTLGITRPQLVYRLKSRGLRL